MGRWTMKDLRRRCRESSLAIVEADIAEALVWSRRARTCDDPDFRSRCIDLAAQSVAIAERESWFAGAGLVLGAARRNAEHRISESYEHARRVVAHELGERLMSDIEGYPIFRSGTWNGMTFTDEDLQGIADAFAELSDEQAIPLKLGHADEHMKDGAPAYGWVKNVRRVGSQLLADFADVPTILRDAIRKRLYRSVSVELWQNVKHAGRTFRHVLDAVAILGAQAPAVKGLPDLRDFLASREALFGDAYERATFTMTDDGGASKRPTVEEIEQVIYDELRRIAPEVYSRFESADALFTFCRK